MQGELLAKLIEIKPADRVTINDYFNAGYFGFIEQDCMKNPGKSF